MPTPLQLMVQGPGIGAYDDVSVEGEGVAVTGVTKADSPNYLFVDLAVAPDAAPGMYTLLFKNGRKKLKYSYEVAARGEGFRGESFSTKDLIYLIVPDRFANGDPENDSTPDTREGLNRAKDGGRHGGDLQGIIDHLDYIADLGATAIWCTPLLEDNDPRYSYHGYACTDYYHIDSRFGTNALYRDYVRRAHKKGIKVIMDVVTNHCSSVHWWMEDLPFKDWVHLKDPIEITNHAMSVAMDPNASKADTKLMEEGWFVQSMADMNLDNPFVLRYFQQWAIWWIEYAGLDGIRVDTWPYNEKYAMAKWAKAVTDAYPGFNIVGEVWNLFPDMVAYWQKDNPNRDGFNSQLPSVMDFPLMTAMVEALSQPGEGRSSRNGDIGSVYQALAHDFIYKDLSHMMIFLANHDAARIGDVFEGHPEKLKLGMTMLATLRGIPQLFYGDEMMFMTGNPRRDDGRLRMDFPGGWPGDKLNLFTEEGRKADKQAAELHDYCRTLFQWRKGKEVIHSGKLLHFLPEKNTYGYFRYNEKEVVFVFLNNSDKDVTVPWTRYSEISAGLGEGRNVLTGEKIRLSDGTPVPAGEALVVEFVR
ncbi:MAG: glycoside hydrolase family 13 protein [Clostridia bacterium]|nr:glycoside hydrolase family 13 protein [Clostridia bacterium]